MVIAVLFVDALNYALVVAHTTSTHCPIDLLPMNYALNENHNFIVYTLLL